MRLVNLLAVAVIAILFIVSASIIVNAAPTGYAFVKTHSISGSPDGALTDYQVKFVVHNGTGLDNGQDVFLNGHSLSWPNDIRFTNNNDVLLSYWVESSDANTATIWVKVDNLPISTGTATVKLYYGKSNDVNASDGSGTFLVFDDFLGSSLDLNKWSTSGPGSYSVSNGYLRLSSTSGEERAHILNSIPTSKYVLEIQGKVVSPYNGNKYRPGVLFKQGASPNDNAVGFDTWAYDDNAWVTFDYPQWTYRHEATNADISTTDAYNGNFRLRLTVNDGSYTCQEILRNKVISSTTSLTGNYFSIMAEKVTNDYDWIFVRKYTANEPTHGTWGLETPLNSPLASYSYVKTNTITGSQDGAQTNYQIKFIVHNGIGSDNGQDVFLNGHSLSWPNDIRFTNNNDGLLSYWIESNNSSTSTVWVKIDSIPASPGTVTIKLYYGKSGDIGYSSGSATFLFFDDFNNGGTINPQWNNGYNPSLVTQANGLINITSNSGAQAIAANNNIFGPGNSVRFMAKTSATNTEFAAGLETPDQSNRVEFYGQYNSIATIARSYSNGQQSNSGTLNSAKNLWHIYESKWRTGYAGFDVDNVYMGSITSNIPTTVAPRPLLGPWNVGTLTLDWYLVRKYTANEPIQGTWGQETPTTTIPPVAGFTSNTTTGYAPLTVQFTDTSTNSPTGWQWNFGDGTANSTIQNPIHTYANVGNYTVILTASNAGGSNTLLKANYIFANQLLPIANFAGNPVSGHVPLTVQFTDGSLNGPTSWQWNFGDGSSNGTVQNPVHTYTAAGTYTVTMTATNAGGNSTLVRTGYIQVSPPTPVAAFTANVTFGYVPLTVQFTDGSLNGPTSWQWNFGDGSSNSTLQNPIHTYNNGGIYTVTLTVSNSAGSNTLARTNYITVNNVPDHDAVYYSGATNYNVNPGSITNFVITMKNTGANTWHTNQPGTPDVEMHALNAPNKMQFFLNGPTTCEQGSTHEFKGQYQAPNNPGVDTIICQLEFSNCIYFGDQVTMTFTVGNPSPTPTPSPSPSPTPSPSGWTAVCVGSTAGDYDSTNDVIYASNEFSSAGYSSNYFINQRPDTVINEMQNSQIFYFTGHGQLGGGGILINKDLQDTINGQLYTQPFCNYVYADWTYGGNSYFTMHNDVTSLDKVLLMYYGGCNTGENNTDFGNLLTESQSKGAICSVGFIDEIYIEQMDVFDNAFARALNWGYPVWQAIGYAQSVVLSQFGNYGGANGGVSTCTYAGDDTITIYPVSGDTVSLTNNIKQMNTSTESGLEQSEDSVRQFLGTSNANFSSIHKADISSGKTFWSMVANNTLFSVDSSTGKIDYIMVESVKTPGTVKLSLNDAKNNANVFLKKYNKNFAMMNDTQLVNSRLIDLGNDGGKQYQFTWREVINGIYTLNSTSISINPTNGELISYASTEEPLLVNLNQSTILKVTATNVAAKQFTGINMSDLKINSAQLKVGYASNHSQALIWDVELEEIEPTGIIHGGDVQVNAVTGEVINVNPYC